MTERSGYVPASDFTAIESRDEATGEITGMVGYDRWSPVAAQAHVAVDRPSRELLKVAFRYPFEMIGRLFLFGHVRASNKKAIRLAKHLGFKDVAHLPDYWGPGDDEVVFRMSQRECRWIGGRS